MIALNEILKQTNLQLQKKPPGLQLQFPVQTFSLKVSSDILKGEQGYQIYQNLLSIKKIIIYK